MLNMFKVRKYAALIVASMLTVVLFYIGTIYYGFWIGLAFMGVGLILSILTGNLLLANPFRSLLEGKGILVFDVNSTGILRPFIVSVISPYIKGKVNGEEVNDVFDREAVQMMAAPKKAEKAAQERKDGGIKIDISEEELNRGRFALYHFPVLLYNSQNKTIITKDFLAETEKNSFAEHTVLYLNRKMEELTSAIRDFGRYAVELTKPKSNIFQSKIFWIILIVGLAVLALLFAKPIIEVISGFMAPAQQAISTAAGEAVTKR